MLNVLTSLLDVPKISLNAPTQPMFHGWLSSAQKRAKSAQRQQQRPLQHRHSIVTEMKARQLLEVRNICRQMNFSVKITDMSWLPYFRK